MDDKKALGKGLNDAVYPGVLLDQKGGKICDVAIKQFPGLNFSSALQEILNNSRLYESHPNIVPLRAVQYDIDEDTSQICKLRLLFEQIKGKNLKDFIINPKGDF
jgi:hypothetical protein